MALWEQGQEEPSSLTQGGMTPTAAHHFETDHFGQSLSTGTSAGSGGAQGGGS